MFAWFAVLACVAPKVDTAETAIDTDDTDDTDDTVVDSGESGTAAPDPAHVTFVVDISGSWSRPNMAGLHDGLVAALDALAARGVAGDSAALVTFHGRYAETYTPWFDVSDAAALADARALWSLLEVVSKGGTGQEYPRECTLNADSPAGVHSARNKFEAPYTVGGCYPDMPREYTDEPGTDHTTGLSVAAELHAAAPAGVHALVLLTDGVANGIAAANGLYRVELGYVEPRWDVYIGPAPHSTSEIEAETPALAAALYADHGVETWVVTSPVGGAWLDATATGRGTSITLADAGEFSAALVGIVGWL